MSNRFTHVVVIVIATAAVVAGIFLVTAEIGQSQGNQGNQGSPGQPRRTFDGKPDFSGIWQANSSAHWDLLSHGERPTVGQPGYYPNVPVLAAPVLALGALGWIPPGLGVVEGDAIPYLPWAAARQKENLANWLERDPELRCYLPGVPRAMYMPYPFQIIQGPKKVMMTFQFRNADRILHLDEVDPYPSEAYMGHSVAKWEGDTLVVNVSSFTPYTWFDRSGNFHSDALQVTERYTPIGRDAIQYEATMTDPQVFTRPWKISLPLYRHLEANAQVIPWRCSAELTEETFLGHLRRNQIVKRWEGRTMIIDVTRRMPPEDLLYEIQVSGNPPLPARR